jgi:type II secretory ATPase GspE/PulE/Tfp pilus assembly ATPase PilB-like protein
MLGRRILPIYFTAAHRICSNSEIEKQHIVVGSAAESRMRHVTKWSWHNGAEGLLSEVIGSAIDLRASDIHLEPKRNRIRIRFRIHGTLYEQPPISIDVYGHLVQRVKVVGGMDPDLSTSNQDGAAIQINRGQQYELRLAVAVIDRDEEAIVIRIMSPELPMLDELGLAESDRNILRECLCLESGLIVLSGPTGSGKTTTLYALLRALDAPTKSIVTIEQPIEKSLPGAKQIEAYPGPRSFCNAIRTVLRLDPDIIMVGEVRDRETAEAVVQAALTGHLVLTTVHSIDAFGIIERFCGSFGIDRVTFSTLLKLCIAQRLVRKLCPDCSVSHTGSDDVGIFPTTPGCSTCQYTGLVGREALTEIITIDAVLREMIAKRTPEQEVYTYLHTQGFESLESKLRRKHPRRNLQPSDFASLGIGSLPSKCAVTS